MYDPYHPFLVIRADEIIKNRTGSNFFSPDRTHHFNITADFSFSDGDCNPGIRVGQGDTDIRSGGYDYPSIRILGHQNIRGLVCPRNVLDNMLQEGSRQGKSFFEILCFEFLFLFFFAFFESTRRRLVICPEIGKESYDVICLPVYGDLFKYTFVLWV